MEKERVKEEKITQMDPITRVYTKMMQETVKEKKSGLMELCISVNIKMICLTDRAQEAWRMEDAMKVLGLMESLMGSGEDLSQTVHIMKANSRKANITVKEHSSIPTILWSQKRASGKTQS